MGLNSVVLIIEVEKFFDINISDIEAEKIFTVQNMVDSVGEHLNIVNENIELRDRIFQRIVTGFHKIGLTNKSIELSDSFHLAFLNLTMKFGTL